MALDYSTLSEAELQAIANDDYSKLSDDTLQAIAAEHAATAEPDSGLTKLEAAGNQPSAVNNAAAYAGQSAGTAYGKYLGSTGGGIIGDAAKVVKALGQSTPSVIGEVMAHPVHFAQEGIKAYAAGLPMANKPLTEIAGSALKGAGSSFLAPENVFTLPYNMAAYEQAKIRANPNAPGLQSNPYAMQVRGEAPTQAAAGAMNQRRAVAGMSTAGNPVPGTPAFRQLQEQQDKAILSQPPAAQNFIERMKALANLYGGTGQ
jgi:hypothetical protein